MIEKVKTVKTAAYVDEGLRQHMLRVYNYMAGGLCITALAAYLSMTPFMLKILFNIGANGHAGLSGFGWLMFFSPLIMIFAFGWVLARGTAGQVKAAFWVFSGLMGVSISPILLMYTQASITSTFLATAGMFGAMSIYGYTTKKDLTSWGSFLIMGLWGLIIASIINIFLGNSGLYYAISFISVIVFTGLTAYDTQKIREIYYASDSGDIATKKAVTGALALYMDFINLFLALLRLFGNRR